MLTRALILLAALAISGVSASASGSLPGTVTGHDRAAWRTLLHWPASCEASWAGQSGAGIAGVWPIGDGDHLIAVDCSLAAYQGTSMLYLLDAGRRPTGPLVLRIYVDRGSGKPEPTTTTLVLGTIDYAPATGTLSVRNLARGAGDCGIYSTFRLVGTRVFPVSARAKACDDKPPLATTRWPKLPLPGPAPATSSGSH